MLNYEEAIVSDEIAAAPQIRRRLAERVQAVLRNAGAARFVRVTLPLAEAISPFVWLRAQAAPQKLYWSGRSTDRAVAAAGTADLVASQEPSLDFEQLEATFDERLGRADAAMRYYGGLAFDAEQPCPNMWRSFGAYRFVLPRFELVRREDEAVLACNLVLPRDAGQAALIQAQIEQLTWPSASEQEALPRAVARADVPDRPAWQAMIDWALTAFRGTALDKVVLARRSTFDFLDVLDPFTLLERLHAATPGCFHFLVQPMAGTAFLGASPERLFQHEQALLRTEAVAGTRSRGDSVQADAALRDELLESEKDRREHAFVEAAIRARLGRLCTTVEQEGEAGELRLTRGRHLRSQFRGRLCAECSTFDVLHVLHPTPAVGGVPREEALRAIRTQEPFARGWYAGPVGWIGQDAAEFAVAIRSGLVRDKQLALYSGAGIVEGSEADREWSEIEQKIGDFAAVLELTS